MSEGELHQIRVDRKDAPIVGNQRVRRSGARRQAVIALFVVVFAGGVMTAGYFIFVPGESELTVTDYTAATVQVETLLDAVEIGGSVAARTTATVTTPEEGFMERLFVNEGDWVEEGALVARIDARDLADELESLERSLERSERELDRFLLEHEYAMRRSERTRSDLEEALEEARADLVEIRELRQIGSASRSEVEEAEGAVRRAEDALSDHDADAEEAVALHELSLVTYEDDIDATRESIVDLRDRMEETAITAPISGRVLSVSEDATVAGELLQQYETVLQLGDTRDPLVESEIEEQYVSLIDIGQPVAVEIGGERYEGAIGRIGQTASSSSDGGTPTVEIDISIAAEAGEILPGTSALVEVLIGQIDDALVLPRGPYLTSGNRRYLFRVDGTRAERIEVEYGSVTDEHVQVLSGVEAGDRIITSSYQNYVDRKNVTLGGKE